LKLAGRRHDRCDDRLGNSPALQFVSEINKKGRPGVMPVSGLLP
jgi:hypothetical protein